MSKNTRWKKQMLDFANYLKNIRISNCLTQTKFAAMLNIDSAALSKIENAKKELDPQKLEIIAKEFNIDFNELKKKYFGEKIAIELYDNRCPVDTLQVAEDKYHYLNSKE